MNAYLALAPAQARGSRNRSRPAVRRMPLFVLLATVNACGTNDGVSGPTEDAGDAESDVGGQRDAGPTTDVGPTVYDGFDVVLRGPGFLADGLANCDARARAEAGDFEAVAALGFPPIDYGCATRRTWELTPAQLEQVRCLQRTLEGDPQGDGNDNPAYCGTLWHESLPGRDSCDDCVAWHVEYATETCGTLTESGLVEVFAACLVPL